MKFTEEQYRAIVEAWDVKNSYSESTKAVTEMIIHDFNKSWKYDIEQALALGNETSREWAHEQFVEKEKKYLWTSKKMSSDGTRLRLQNTGTNGVVRAYGKYKDRKADWTEHLTESEIKACGYNPEVFDKEEVE